ncbi:MAG: hypothetical protein H7Y32_16315 [Chloroflexales bacterium]|nr:hypothetical protein [Chloroflexales bacterium]
MLPLDHIVHERTLIGAIDSYMGGLVHVRPHLAGDYREQLEALADAALDAGFANAIEAPGADWLRAYLHRAPNPEHARAAINDFYRWAVAQSFVASHPLDD